VKVRPENAQTARVTERPGWLRVRAPSGPTYEKTLDVVQSNKLHTVCQSAHCPNMGECWSSGTATFMILGNICTRTCGFCAVKTGTPTGLDLDEPRRVAEAVRLMGIKFAVVTSVNRDELADGGASIFAKTIREIRRETPECRVEVLIPDFRGDLKAVDVVIEAAPAVINHNMETVPRLYKLVRPQARYDRSLAVIEHVSRSGALSKSGLMVGLGEEDDEVLALMNDLSARGCRIVTIGQYLPPTLDHLEVKRFVHPTVFERFRRHGESLGFAQIKSGPLVRSSYHADESARDAVSPVS